jgi:hypothetical protein
VNSIDLELYLNFKFIKNNNEIIFKCHILLCSTITKFINIKFIFVMVDTNLTMIVVYWKALHFDLTDNVTETRKFHTEFSFYFLPRNYFIQIKIRLSMGPNLITYTNGL